MRRIQTTSPPNQKNNCTSFKEQSAIFLPFGNNRNHDLSKPLTELTAGDDTEDKYQQETSEQYEWTDTDVGDEENLAQPKKKKAKVQVREVIKAAGREIGQGWLTDTVDHEAGHGTKTQATRLVFPFLSCPYPCSHLIDQHFFIFHSIAI